MNSQTDSKSEISANHQDFQEISSKRLGSSCGLLARDVGFEPTRPFLTTDLAGLPPTRLGQSRKGVPTTSSAGPIKFRLLD
jgi:hypothetical protein